MKHIPKHMKMPLIKNAKWMRRRHIEYDLIKKGYSIPGKYLGGK